MRQTDLMKKTKCIGVTGGVGSGKSAVLDYLKEKTRCRVFYSDDEAKKLYIQGIPVFDKIIQAAGEDVLTADGKLDKERFAARIFDDKGLLDKINSIVHPAMQGIILDEMAYERAEGKRDLFFVEAALLIECGYEALLDEIWYVYAPEDVRRRRLKENRDYSDEKISAVFASQLSDEEYRKHCKRVIDNGGTMEAMRASVDSVLKEFEDITVG